MHKTPLLSGIVWGLAVRLAAGLLIVAMFYTLAMVIVTLRAV
jgi:hypothetical protein